MTYEEAAEILEDMSKHEKPWTLLVEGKLGDKRVKALKIGIDCISIVAMLEKIDEGIKEIGEDG